MKRLLILGLIVALCLVATTGVVAVVDPGGAPSGDGVDPVFYTGNPDCGDIGYGYGFKIDGCPSGTYTFTNPPGELTGGAPPDSYNRVTLVCADPLFNWTSTMGIDAVIVKGGPNADAFVYIPEDTADTSLHAPVNPENGQYYGISHIEFCYDYELTATKTADASYTRTYTWTIDKSVDDDSHSGYAGDKFTSNYDVVVDQTVTDSDWAVSGNIVVTNPTPFTVSFSVSDSVGGTTAVVSCPTYSLAPGASTTCTYSAALSGAIDGTNTATITSNTAGVGGATATDGYDFDAPTTVVGYPTINVKDYFDGDLTGEALGSASGDYTFEFPRNFVCPTDESKYEGGLYTKDFPNTATITETGQSDNEEVTLDCVMLTGTGVFEKTAVTTFTRTYNWTINKSADQASLTLAIGQSFLVNYEVTVDLGDPAYTDSDCEVSGVITITNPSEIDIVIDDLTDALSVYGAVSVDCGDEFEFPYTLEPAETLICSYTQALSACTDQTNTATVVVGDVSTTADADVTFSDPAKEVDECIDVSDTYAGYLGKVCYGDTLPKTFTYSRYIGPYEVCGDYTVDNTASFVTTDSGATGSDDWTVDVNVPCGGCTLTPGYWKTHSFYGPAPYDDAWLSLGDADGDGIEEGQDETFFLSGQTYYEVLWTNPVGGNAYYILAHAYIAAELNLVNGASSTAEVDAAMTWAETFFNTYKPTDKLTRTDRNEAIAKAAILDNYNNGLIGPGHCSE